MPHLNWVGITLVGKGDMMNNHQYFNNIDCKYYPCHEGIDNINCLFCYCPLYYMECGGDYVILADNIKDCSKCTRPHDKMNYSDIINKIPIGKYIMGVD